MQGINNTRQTAWSSTTTTIEEMVMALLVLFLFSLFSIILKGTTDKKPYHLPYVFLFALLGSQYLLFGEALLRHITPSGISLFFVDSLLTMICFGLFVELQVIAFIRKVGSLDHVKSPKGLGASKGIFTVFAVIWPVMLFFISISLLENIGLLWFNSSFADSYLVHLGGLVEFVLIFAYVFYYKDILIAIRKISNAVARTWRQRS